LFSLEVAPALHIRIVPLDALKAYIALSNLQIPEVLLIKIVCMI